MNARREVIFGLRGAVLFGSLALIFFVLAFYVALTGGVKDLFAGLLAFTVSYACAVVSVSLAKDAIQKVPEST